MRKILVAEDEQNIREFVVINLERAGYKTYEAETGDQALALYAQEDGDFDVAVLDIMMPGEHDGLAVCKELRRRNPSIGIILLSARTQEMDKVSGLMMGADDYVFKPFRIRELQSRIRAVLRRKGGTAVSTLPGGIRIDLKKAEVTRDGEPVALSALEYRLLLTFVSNPGQTLTRRQLLAGIWDEGGSFVNDNTLTVYIKRLRDKLESPGCPPLIATVRGLGYRLEV